VREHVFTDGCCIAADGRVVDLLDDRRRRSRRNEHAVPELEVVVGQPASRMPGRSGTSGERSRVLTAIARSRRRPPAAAPTARCRT
jgi:hypothetical protein